MSCLGNSFLIIDPLCGESRDKTLKPLNNFCWKYDGVNATETFSALLNLCVGNTSVDSYHKMPVMWGFGVL